MTMAVPTETRTLPATTRIGTVHLTVRDLPRARDFYERALGMSAGEHDDGTVTLGPVGSDHVLRLTSDPNARPRNPRETGLFHFAVLVPSRVELANALVRLARAGWPLDGASDHLVSEALYLTDPEGNGIEIYRDRPRSEWRRDAAGQLEMATLPLDLNQIVAELGEDPMSGPETELATGTTIGHIHLQVASIPEVERFYADVLGFDVMVRGYPGALFVAAGGYHHHIGLNTWNSRGAQAPAPDSAGLRFFEVRTGSPEGVEAALTRAEHAGLTTEPATLYSGADGVLLRDPSGNAVLLRA